MDLQHQFISTLEAYCSLRNVETKASLARIGREPSLKDLDMMWKSIMYDSADELFGLHFGESMQLTALGIVGQIVTTSNTVGEALAKGASMVPLIAEGFEINSAPIDSSIQIELQCAEEISTKYPYYHKSIRDFLVALIIHELDGLIVGKIAPSLITGPFSSDSSEEYCRVLRCPDYAHSKNISITLDMELLGMPIITVNYRMQQYLESLLRENMPLGTIKTEFLKDRVSAYIMGNSYLRILSIDDVAANFNLSSRTLQRKLKDEGSSFKEIVDHVRKTLALEYLKDKDNQIKDVAYSLGYNESSAFVRAFKRWTGTTPSLYFS